LLAACSGKPQTPPSQEASVAVSSDAGVQTVTGRAPALSAGFAAIVVLEPIGGGPQPDQATAPTMDQAQETFIPSMLLVRTGQKVNFLNHDDVLHNVRVRNDQTRESSFNVAIPTGENYSHVFPTDGFYDVGCDIHPGMSASIFASSSPYAVIADASGAFTIPNVPNGPYKAVAYSGARKIEKEINVTAGVSSVDLTSP
jgi:plastocyanin